MLEPGFGSRSDWCQKLELLTIVWKEAKQVSWFPETGVEVPQTDLYHNLAGPWQQREVFRRHNLPAFCIFVNFRVLSDLILLRVLKPILNHFSDVFNPTPNTEVKSWNGEKGILLVSKIIIMIMKWIFSSQAIKKKCKKISDPVSPEYDKQVGDGSFLETFLFQKGPFLACGCTKWNRSEDAGSGICIGLWLWDCPLSMSDNTYPCWARPLPRVSYTHSCSAYLPSQFKEEAHVGCRNCLPSHCW